MLKIFLTLRVIKANFNIVSNELVAMKIEGSTILQYMKISQKL